MEEYASGHAPKDGQSDFSKYSDAQLADLRDQLDAVRFPENFRNLVAEIARRAQAGRLGRGRRFAARFTDRAGIAGWVQAVLSWQPLYGRGSIQIDGDEVLLQGLRRTWLGMQHQDEIVISASLVRNAYQDEDRVVFEKKANWRPSHTFRFHAASPAEAGEIVVLLPPRKSRWFEMRGANAWEFYQFLRASDRRTFITPLLVLANLAVYAALCIHTGLWGGFDMATLADWGSNYGPTTSNGQWWRLLTSLFLHANLLHVGINLWVLWAAGRLTERLYGNAAFLAIYLVAGLASGLASIAWNPAVSSVGASGAIFGVLGAFVAYLGHGETKVPLSMIRAHLIPTTLFILFSIANGIWQPGIDNAAHVGGLLSGFLLGWACAVPPRALASSGRRLLQTVTAFCALLGLVVLLFVYADNDASHLYPGEEYIHAQSWYVDGEAKNLRLWQKIAIEMGNGNVSPAQLSYLFEKQILPFWQSSTPRLQRTLQDAPAYQKPFAATVLDFSRARLRWARAIIAYAKSASDVNSTAVTMAMQAADLVQAHVDRMTMRTEFDHRARSLANAPFVVTAESLLWYAHWKCVKYPFSQMNPVAATDKPDDGPAQADALGCQAQNLFLTRDFATLESLLNRAATHLNDLPDGASSYDAMMASLSTLLNFGGLPIEAQLDRTAAWRLAFPGSVQADLVEADAFFDWGYVARGNGSADTINQQNLILFMHRTEMAAAALRAMASKGVDNPYWYVLSLNVGLIQEIGDQNMAAIFQRGRERFPNDYSIYSQMLHAMMPRWGGSYEKEAAFIAAQTLKQVTMNKGSYAQMMTASELYARLYWEYADLEDDNPEVFQYVKINIETMETAFASMAWHYPRSDYIQNGWGKFACILNNRDEYLLFHKMLPARYSASAWSKLVSVESCDSKFHVH